MPPSRRINDKCIAKKLYEQGTPYVQILGWVAVMCSVFIGIGVYYSKVEAYDGRINEVASHVNAVDSQQRQMMILLQRIDQRVSDMYDRGR